MNVISEKEIMPDVRISEAIKKNLHPYPVLVEIHPTDKCNENCNYCFHRGKGFNGTRDEDQFIDLETYFSLFREIVLLGIRKLQISGGGEPFFDKRTPRIIKAANDQNLEIRILSNGTIIPKECLEELMRVHEIRISVDAIDPATYSRLRGVSPKILSRVISNVEGLVKYKKKTNSSLRVVTAFVINPENYLEVKQFCQGMLNLGVDGVVVRYDVRGTANLPDGAISRIDRALSEVRDSRLQVKTRVTKIGLPGMKCYIPYLEAVFNSYGDLYSCCLGAQPLQENGYYLGSLKNASFKELWTAALPKIQNLHIEGVSCTNCGDADYRLNKRIDELITAK